MKTPMFNQEPEDDFLKDIMPEGRMEEWEVFQNHTGQIHRMGKVNITQYDKNGMPIMQDINIRMSGIDGPILDTENVSFCAVSGTPVSKINSVIDPFCGRVLSLPCSTMIEVDDTGTVYRVCGKCAKAIKRKQLRDKIISFLWIAITLPLRIIIFVLRR